MTDYVTKFSSICAERNATVRACRKAGNVSLEKFVSAMADKVSRNKAFRPLKDPGDFYSCTSQHVEKLLGKKAAREIEESVRLGVMSTSDHHGGLFCSQTFQGDIIFGELIHRLGSTGRYVPIHSGGQVELGNATYARGFYSYASVDNRQQIPLFPYKDRNRLSSHAEAVTPEMIDALYRRLNETDEFSAARDAVKDVCRPMWGDTSVPESGRFADQTVIAGCELSKRLFKGGNGPILTYIELEEVVTPLLKEEIMDPDSLPAHLMLDPKMRQYMQQVTTPEGVPLSGLLFRNADDKGRKSLLTLTPEGELLGSDWRNKELRYTASAKELCRLLDERRIFPGLFLMALILAFERGITWMGGMFQAQYLPMWQSCLVKLLADCGFKSESELFARYQCDGYVCGPMFAEYEGEGFATCAGPLEFHMIRPEWESVREQMLKTGLWDAHLIGLTEMYFDLVSPREREDGWYEKVSRELYHRFPSNVLQG